LCATSSNVKIANVFKGMKNNLKNWLLDLEEYFKNNQINKNDIE